MSKKSKTFARRVTMVGFLVTATCTLMQVMQGVTRTVSIGKRLSTLTHYMHYNSSSLLVSSKMTNHQADRFSELSNNTNMSAYPVKNNSMVSRVPSTGTYDGTTTVLTGNNDTSRPLLYNKEDRERKTPSTTGNSTTGVNVTMSSDSTMASSRSLVNSNNSAVSFEDLRIAIFITTHMSNDHINFLRRCWPAAFEIVPMLTQSDCILFTTEDPPSDLHPSVFNNFHSFQMYKYENPGYHEGALLAMATAMDGNWFANFDWVIRVNADVLIRDDSFFRRVFVDPSIDAIFVKCINAVQTDFFAFRPNSTAPGAFRRQKHDRPSAEPDTTLAFRETLEQTKRYRWLEGGHMNHGHCRVVGRDSPVIHDHGFVNQCPDLKTHHAQNVW